MTKRQHQNRRMATPRPSPEQRRANYEAHLLRELVKRCGWKQTGPVTLQKVGQ